MSYHLSLLVSSLIVITSLLYQPIPQYKSTSHSSKKIQINTIQSPELTLSWETDTILRTVESVIYDPLREVLYTANIDGHFMDKDGVGSIGKVSLSGDVIEAQWISGLDAPTGLAIYGDILYTTDIDKIIVIHIPTGQIVRTIQIEGAKCLNDITVGEEGAVFCSDTPGNRIYAVIGDDISIAYDNVTTPNGLLVHDYQLAINAWTPQTFSIGNLGTGEIDLIANNIPQADGVSLFREEGWLVSSWGGKIHHISRDGTASVILDTQEDHIQAADVTYIPSANLIIVACFSSNKLMAYGVKS